MYNPEDNPKDRIKTPIAQTKPSPQLLPEKEILRNYLLNSARVRERYGFGLQEGRLWIKDLKVLEAVDSATKALLRELYLELK